MTDKPIGVLIVDDNQMVRTGLQMVLSSLSDIVLVGEASNGEEAILFCEVQLPDVILMDIGMPIMNGIDATHAIRAKHPEVQVIIITNYLINWPREEVVRTGAFRCIEKDITAVELINTIRAAYKQGKNSGNFFQAPLMDIEMLKRPNLRPPSV